MQSLTIYDNVITIQGLTIEQTDAIVRQYNEVNVRPLSREAIVNMFNSIDLDTLDGQLEMTILVDSIGTVNLDPEEDVMKTQTVNLTVKDRIVGALYSAKEAIVNNVVAAVSALVALVSAMFINVVPLYYAGTTVKAGFIFLYTTTNVVAVVAMVAAILVMIYS
jgi:hypothetical protein